MRRTVTLTIAALAVLAAAGQIGTSSAAVPASQQAGQQKGLSFRPDIITLGRISPRGADPDGASLNGTRPDDIPDTIADCREAFNVPCYDPAEIQQAYGTSGLYASGITGKGTTIVIVDPYGSPSIRHDLTTFDSAYDLPAPPSLTVIKPAGHVPSYHRNNAAMLDWAGETTLDVEYSHAMAPGAKILLVETPTAGADAAADVAKAETYVVKHHLGGVISQSFGTTEQAIGSLAQVSPFRTAYRDAAAAHVTVLAAAGDTGATDPKASGTDLYTYPVTQWPATDPLVTAVGGSKVNLDHNGTRTAPDTAWNDTYNHAANQLQDNTNGPSALATGGGKSALFARPSYQKSDWRTVAGKRGIPDVSMNGACSSPVNVYQGFPGQQAGWYVVCGTSESTPLFAGIVALAGQVAGHPLGLINPALYQLAATHAKGIVPITSGNNSVEFTQGGRKHWVHGYPARHGYSLTAGLGTIDAQYFVPELAKLG